MRLIPEPTAEPSEVGNPPSYRVDNPEWPESSSEPAPGPMRSTEPALATPKYSPSSNYSSSHETEAGTETQNGMEHDGVVDEPLDNDF